MPPRQYDEKFHILQAPQLFLPDLAYFRAKCEDRETPLAIAFVDIDDFKSKFNTPHGETKVDRNVLPRFMQAMEAHAFHHGYAYRQGGDEYLILLPSLSRPLAVAFLDELRCKLADLAYPDVAEKTTASIGLCIVDSDCPLTDRELLDRANLAKQFAKENGKNRIATFRGPRFVDQELEIVKAPAS
jgi:diguanylate cyclase (GGDEF)-like protein